MKIIETIVKSIALIIAFSLWTPIGFLVWIALFMRLIGVFTADILFRAMSSSKKINNYTEQFSIATKIYPHGFLNIFKALFDNTETTHTQDDFSWTALAKTAAWTIFFWFFTTFAFNLFDSRLTIKKIFNPNFEKDLKFKEEQRINDSIMSKTAFDDSVKAATQKDFLKTSKQKH